MTDVVILVHGTFATSPAEDGPSWWQRDSEHWRWLARHLPPGVELPGASVRLFTWDGRNSQISRLHAANRLLALLLELERQGRGYHLVGHSHGGSVIWEALISAEVTRRHGTVYAELRRALNDDTVRLGGPPIVRLRDDEFAPGYVKYKTRHLPRTSEYAAVEPLIGLPGLRSWTTVGTPFTRYLPVRRLLATGWRSPRLSLRRPTGEPTLREALGELLLVLLLTVPIFLFLTVVIAAMVGADWARATMNSDLADVLAPPIVAGWLGAFWVTGRRQYAETLLAREHGAHDAARRFGDRWLGLWSPADEAINALSATVRHDVPYEWLCAPTDRRAPRRMPALPVPVPLPRLAVPMPVGATHLLPQVVTIAPMRVTTPLIAAANRWLEPRWRRTVARALTRTAQGADLPAAVAAYVSPWPLPLAGARTLPGLPATAIARLGRTVAEQNATLGPKARELLMRAALEGVPDVLDGAGSGPAGLVHTAYFADDDVRRLILHHIHRSSPTPARAASTAGDELSVWLTDHRRAVQRHFAAFPDQAQPIGAPTTAPEVDGAPA
jgi:hypothetical protein